MIEAYPSLCLVKLLNIVVKILGFGTDYLGSNTAPISDKLCYFGKRSCTLYALVHSSVEGT